MKRIFFIIIMMSLGLLGSPPKSVKIIQLLDHQLGSKLNPVKCEKDSGELAYLLRLKDPRGKPVSFKRIGHGGPTTDGHYFDRYLIQSEDRLLQVEIYMDMYCDNYVETFPINGFVFDSLPGQAKKTPRKSQYTLTGKKNGNQSKKTVLSKYTNKSTKSKPGTNKTAQKATTTSNIEESNEESSGDDDRIPGFDDEPDTTVPKSRSHENLPASTMKHNSQKPQSVGEYNESIPGFDKPMVKGSTGQTAQAPPIGTVSPGLPFLSLIPILDSSNLNQSTPEVSHTGSSSKIIDEVVNDSLLELKKETDINLAIQQAGHTINHHQDEIDTLCQIIDSNKTSKEKMKAIDTQVLEPRQIDLLITGTRSFDKTKGNYSATLIVISKPDNKYFSSKPLQWKENETGKGHKKTLKKELVKIIKRECPMIFNTESDEESPLTAGMTVYVCILPFSEKDDSKENQKQSQEKNLSFRLNQVMADAVTDAKNKNNTFNLDISGSILPDTGAAIKDLNHVLTDPGLKDNEKIEKVIQEIMAPNRIDYLLTAIINPDLKNDIITIQPYIIDKKQKKLFTVNLIFQNDELNCRETDNDDIHLCEESVNDINNALQMLLARAIK